MKLNLMPDKDPWYKRLTGLFGGAIPFVLIIAWAIWSLGYCSSIRTGNDVCDKRCVAKGYPAGEVVSPREWKHDVCVCWPAEPSPPAYFLLERND